MWAQRYFRAYLRAHNLPFRNSFGTQKGHSKRFDKKGAPVTAKMLGTHVGEPAQNKAVQDYLKSTVGFHIKMDSTKPPQTWTYTFQTTGSAPGVKTSGMKRVADPTPKGDLLPTGGIW